MIFAGRRCRLTSAWACVEAARQGDRRTENIEPMHALRRARFLASPPSCMHVCGIYASVERTVCTVRHRLESSISRPRLKHQPSRYYRHPHYRTNKYREAATTPPRLHARAIWDNGFIRSVAAAVMGGDGAGEAPKTCARTVSTCRTINTKTPLTHRVDCVNDPVGNDCIACQDPCTIDSGNAVGHRYRHLPSRAGSSRHRRPGAAACMPGSRPGRAASVAP